MTLDAQHELDATGLLCPEPVMMLHNKVRDMKPGDVLAVRHRPFHGTGYPQILSIPWPQPG